MEQTKRIRRTPDEIEGILERILQKGKTYFYGESRPGAIQKIDYTLAEINEEVYFLPLDIPLQIINSKVRIEKISKSKGDFYFYNNHYNQDCPHNKYLLEVLEGNYHGLKLISEPFDNYNEPEVVKDLKGKIEVKS